MSSLFIRRANIADADALTGLSVSTFVHAFGPPNTKENMDIYLAEAMTREQLTKELQEEDNYFVFIYADGELTGYAKMRTSQPLAELAPQRQIEIERIYVRHTAQGKNIGSALLQHCIDRATSLGYDVLWLGVWEHNPGAIRFYQRHGFQLFSSHPFVFGHDIQTDVLMKLELIATGC